MGAVSLGILLALTNAFVIAIGMATVAREPGVALLVMVFGCVPAVLVGALLGWLANVTKTMPVWARRLVLVAPAALLVIMLGGYFWMQEFILVSCIPTAVATFILERATRLVETPAVPPARARRS